jgi:glycine dehydrogenase subunit 1
MSKLPGVSIAANAPFFKEFPVTFAGRSVREINKFLLEYSIYGGHDLSPDYPSLPNSALYCVNEMMTKSDMDALTSALSKIMRG